MALAMNADIKAELVKRLRSGTYIQGKEKLAAKDKDGTERYCCLGVLCEIAVEAGIIPRSEHEVECWECDHPDDVIHKTEVRYDLRYKSTLPPKVIAWAGIESIDIDMRSDSGGMDDMEGMGRFAAAHEFRNGHTTLAGMNDDEVPFTDIAQFIEDEVIAR